MTFDRNTKRVSTRSDKVIGVADFYRRQLAKIDSPKHRAGGRLAGHLDGYIAGIRETMRFLFTEAEWERMCMVAGNLAAERGENYLELQRIFAEMGMDMPMIEDMT